MIDNAGAAPAATEPLALSQDDDAARNDARLRDAQSTGDRAPETARAAIERAFAEIDAASGQEREGEGGSKAGDPDLAVSQPRDLQKDDEPVAGKPASETRADTLAEPPARFSADARAAWATVPDSVRGEVHRAFREMESGLAQYQRFFEPLKPFYQLAGTHETTVEDSLRRYVALDSELASDDQARKLSAIEHVLDYAGLSPQEYAGLVAEVKADAAPAPSSPEARQFKSELAEMRRLIGGVSATLRQSRESQLESEIAASVEAFARSHPRLNEAEFANTVTRLVGTRMADDLESAYDMAQRLIPVPVTGPQPAASIAADPKPADQTRKGQLSIAGAPVSGSNPVRRKPAATARESLDRVFAEMGFSG
jgi:hypothetical protein